MFLKKIKNIKIIFERFIFYIRKIISSDTVNKRIKKERKNLGISVKFVFFKKYFKQIYLPTLSSGLIIVFIVGLLYLLSILIYYIPEFPDYLSLSNTTNHYQNIISIHSGIGVMIFALIIFMAESMRGRHNKELARVLLRESFIFPLSLSEILIFFIFIFGPINIVTYFSVIILGFFTILSLGRTLRILLNPELLQQKKISLLGDRIINSIDSEINHRLGVFILSKLFEESEIKLKSNFYFSKNRKNFAYISYDTNGLISDINIDNLKEIANLIEKEANNDNLFWDLQKSHPYIEISVEDNKSSIKERENILNDNINRERYLLKNYESYITPDNNFIFTIDKKLLKDTTLISRIACLLPSTFIVKSKNIFEKEIAYELSSIKDQFIDAIQNKHLGEINEFKEIYISTAEIFLEYLKKSNLIHSFKRAQQERSNIFEFDPWNIGWLSKDIYDIFEKAMETNDYRIISEIDHFPISLAKISLNYHDHYLFQQFIRFPVDLYEYSKKVKDKDLELSKKMVDSSWRLLKELTEFNIFYKINHTNLKEPELESYRDFIVYIVLIFQNLLRSTILNKDLASFNIILDSFKDLFSDYYNFSFSRQYKKDSDDEYKVKIQHDINLKYQQIYIGLSSWLLNKLLDETLEKTEFELYHEIYKILFKSIDFNLKNLFYVFINTLDSETDHFFGWIYWDFPHDGKVHSVGFDKNLLQFFCIESLHILNINPISLPLTDIDLPFNREFTYLADDNSRLMNILNDIQINHEKWSLFLSSDEISKIDILKNIFKLIKQKQEQIDNKTIIESNISIKKVDNFKKEVISSFYENVSIRKILKFHKLYQSYLLTEKQLNRLGVNIFEDKQAFFDEWQIEYHNWGEGYGRDIAFGEDVELFRKILNECKKIKIEDFDKKINEVKDLQNMIILTDISSIHSFFHNKKQYTASYQLNTNKKDIDCFKGIYNVKNFDIPIYEIFLRKINNNILLLNLTKLGFLIQFSPLNPNEDISNINDIFYFNVQSFNSDLLKQFLENPPKWLKNIGNIDSQINYLKTKVLIHIFERFDLHFSKDFEGYFFKSSN